MAVSYDKLWKKLIDKKMTKNALRVQAEMSSSTMAKMSKNETVSMDVRGVKWLIMKILE